METKTEIERQLILCNNIATKLVSYIKNEEYEMVNVFFPSSIHKFNLLVNAINKENNNNFDTSNMVIITNNLVEASGFDVLGYLLENELLVEFNKIAHMLEVNLNVKHDLELEINQLSEEEKVEVKGILIGYRDYIYELAHAIIIKLFYLINDILGKILNQITLLTFIINIQDTELVNPNLLKKIFETPTQLEQFTLILKELENKILPEINYIYIFLGYKFTMNKIAIKVKKWLELVGLTYESDGNLILNEYSQYFNELLILEKSRKEAEKIVLNKLATEEYKLEYIKCNCGADDYTIISKRDTYGLPVTQVICKQCGLVYLNPRMNQEAYNDFYDKYYRILCETRLYNLSQDTWEISVVNNRKNKLFELLLYKLETEKLNILEIGCGHGEILEILHDYGHNVRGIDLDSNCVNIAKNKGLNVKQAHTSDLIEKYQGKFDLIIAMHVVEHFLNLDEELSNIKKLLKTDGLFYIEVPGMIGDFYTKFGGSSIPHTYYFNLCTLNNVLNRNGFELVRGTEHINAVYKINEDVKPQIDSNNYEETIKGYENKLELNNK